MEKNHSDEFKLKMSENKKGKDLRSKESIEEWILNVAKKPKSESHKRKIGRKGMIMLKNLDSSECIRVHKSEKDQYDSTLWVNPIRYKKLKGI